MPELPPIPFPPSKIHIVGNLILVIGVDGEICRIDKNNLEIFEDFANPFPSGITNSTICNNLFVATWVENELRQARMAAISLENGFENGISKSELRFSQNDPTIDSSVSGSIWSHQLDAEPIGITSEADMICFANFKRGIYCIDSNSAENWRIPELSWEPMKGYSNSEMIHSILLGPHPNNKDKNCIWVWSISGKWVTLEWSNGSEITRGSIVTKGEVDLVVRGDDGWLIGLSCGEIIRCKSDGSDEENILGGPCNDAINLNGVWHIAGWREDILWSEGGVQRVGRSDLGVALYAHPINGVIVLDNLGNWSPFASN